MKKKPPAPTQSPHPQPPNEAQRLESLRRACILDTQPEPIFDDLTRLAAQICETPIAAISLIDDKRQWLLTRVGLDVRELPREDSFCSHAILQPDQLMEVNDASADVRFTASPLVSGPAQIRFYASAPLLTASGLALGTLCVMDTRPRELTGLQRATLQTLARNLMNSLEIRQTNQENLARQAVLSKVLHSLPGLVDQDEILQTVLQALLALGRWQDIGLSILVNPEQQFWQTRAETFMAPGEVGLLRPIHSGIIGRAYRTGQTQLVPDVRLDPDFFEGQRENPTGSELVVPIHVNGVMSGALNLESPHPAAFNSADVTFAQSICEAIGSALHGAQQFTELRSREAQFSTIFNMAPIGIGIVSPQGKWLKVNQAMCNLLGYSEQDFQALESNAKITHPDDQNLDMPHIDLLIAGKIPSYQLQKRYIAKDGRVIWGLRDVTLIRDQAGEVQYFITQVQDITGRIQHEQALIESETRYRQAIRAAQAIPYSMNYAEGRYSFIDEGIQQLTGYTSAEFTPTLMNSLIVETKMQAGYADLDISQAMEKARAGGKGQPWVCDALLRTRNGELRWFIDSSVQVLDANGIPTGSIGILQDITDRKRIELELQESRDQLEERVRVRTAEVQDLYDNAPCGYLSTDQHGRITNINNTLLNWLGSTREELLGNLYINLLAREEAEAMLLPAIQKIIRETDTVPSIESTLLRKDGSRLPILANINMIRTEAGKYSGARVTIFDNTERQQAAEALRQREAQYHYLFENNPLPMFAYDLESLQILEVNAVMQANYGYTRAEFLALTLPDLHPSEEWETLQALLREDRPTLQHSGEWRHQRKDGRLIDVEITSHTLTLGLRPAALVAAQDITTRKQAEAGRLAAQRELQNFLDNARDMIQSLDAEGNYLYVNKAWCETLGYSLEEAREMTFTQVVDPVYQDHCQAVMRALVTTQQPQQIETIFRTRQGQLVIVEGSLGSHISQEGQFITNSIFRNITARKQAEEILRDSEAQNRLLFEESPDTIALFDQRGKIIRINRASEELTGLPRAELLSHRLDELKLVTPQVVREMNTAFLQAQTSPTNYAALEFCIHRPDGNQREVESRIYALKLGGKNLALVTSRDITARKQAEEISRESELQNRLLFEESPVPIALYDTQNRLVRANHAFSELTQYPLEALLGRHSTDIGLISPETEARLSSVVHEKIRQNTATQPSGLLIPVQYPLIRADGEIREVESRTFLTQIGGQRYGLVTTYDITLQKKSSEALQLANAEMERAIRLKDDFLATMSHELRTPLNGILGLAEILIDGHRGPLNDYQLKYVNSIFSSGRHLLSLINDVLDLSKLEAGKFEIHPEMVLVNEICQASLMFVKEQAVKKDLQINLEMDPRAPTLQADMRRLKQVLVNLLGNAVKFTPAGGKVTLIVRARPEQEMLDFQVIDTGIGITPADQKRLFAPFVQIDSSLSRQYEGTGLGLALVKRMVDLHRGTVSVTSAPGQGSCFTVSLPWHPANAPAHPETPRPEAPFVSPTLPQGTLLLVEDNEVNILTIVEYFERLKYTVIVAHNGMEALEKARERIPTVILMDIQLPDMNGLEAIRHLRADSRFASTPIIALTAMAMSGDRERALAAGANDYVSKPASLKELSQKIIELLRQV